MSAILNEWGMNKPTFPHVTFDMLGDDNFMTRKMDDIVLGGGKQAHVNSIPDKWTERVNISMFDHEIWSGFLPIMILSIHCGGTQTITSSAMINKLLSWDTICINTTQV